MLEERWPHQQEEFEKNVHRPKLALGWEPRLGKTKAAIDFLLEHHPGRVLVSAPLLVCPQWAEQLEQAGFRVTRGYAFKRKEQFDRALFLTEKIPKRVRPRRTPLATALVLNVDKLIGNKKLLEYWGPEVYIGDECHQFQNATSGRTKAMRSIAAQAPLLRFLSGTMMPNNPGNLWPVMQLIDPANWEPTMKQFRDKHLICDYMYPSKIVAIIDPDEIERRLKLCTSRKTRAEVFGPDSTQILIRDVPFSKAGKLLYKTVADEWVAANEAGQVLDATHALSRLVRLQQISAGYAVFEEKPEVVDTSKIEAAAQEAVQLVDNEENVAIFYRFKYEERMLLEALQALGQPPLVINGGVSGDERHAIVADFNRSKGRILVTQLVAGGIGISLASANYALFLTRSFSYVEDTQAKDRIYAPGQAKCLIFFERPKTIDKYIADILARKKNMNDALMSGNLRNIVFGE